MQEWVQFQVGLFRTASVPVSVVRKLLSEAVFTVSTVSGSELRLGARAVRCDASRLAQAVRVKWAVTVLHCRRSVREISGGNWGSACEICSCRGGDWR